MKAMITWSYVQVFQPILNASEGKQMCWAIGAVNVLVWVAWRVPRWSVFMDRSFAHNPLSGRSYTLLTSTFRCVSPHYILLVEVQRAHRIPFAHLFVPVTCVSYCPTAGLMSCV